MPREDDPLEEDELLDEDEPLEDEPPEAPKGRVRLFLEKYRTRIAQAALVIFLVAVLIEVGGALPRDVEVAFRFPAHQSVTAARVTYLQEDEVVREVRLGWPEGAPALVRDTIELSPGDYDVSVLLTDTEGASRSLHGEVSAPADGVVRVRLHP